MTDLAKDKVKETRLCFVQQSLGSSTPSKPARWQSDQLRSVSRRRSSLPRLTAATANANHDQWPVEVTRVEMSSAPGNSAGRTRGESIGFPDETGSFDTQCCARDGLCKGRR